MSMEDKSMSMEDKSIALEQGLPLMDIVHNGQKVGTIVDGIPDVFADDGECRDFLNELRTLKDLKPKHLKTLDNCVAVVTKNENEELNFGPGDILVLTELAFRHPDKSTRIMSCLQYLTNCVDFIGAIPEGFYGEVANAFAYLGSLPNKVDNDRDEDELDLDDKFGYDFGDSHSSDDYVNDDEEEDDEEDDDDNE